MSTPKTWAPKTWFDIYPSFRGYKKVGDNIKTVDTFQFWLNRLITLDSSLFLWHNLPDTMPQRNIELSLLYYGQVLMFKEDVLDGYYCLPVNLAGDYDVYGVPYTRFAYSNFNGYYHKYTPENSVILRNNYISFSHYNTLWQYAVRLANIDRTIDINVFSQRTPLMFKTTKEQELTAKNIFKQYDEFSPVLYFDEDVAEFTSLQVIKTDSPYLSDKLTVLGRNIFNEALSFMGYNNINVEKKERMIKDETMSNNGLIVGEENERLIARKEAVNEFNKLMGTNIKVEVNPKIIAASNFFYNAYSSQWRADPTLYKYSEMGENSTLNNYGGNGI